MAGARASAVSRLETQLTKPGRRNLSHTYGRNFTDRDPFYAAGERWYALASRNILVLEDEPLVAMMLEDELGSMGIHVVGPANNLSQHSNLQNYQVSMAHY